MAVSITQKCTDEGSHIWGSQTTAKLCVCSWLGKSCGKWGLNFSFSVFVSPTTFHVVALHFVYSHVTISKASYWKKKKRTFSSAYWYWIPSWCFAKKIPPIKNENNKNNNNNNKSLLFFLLYWITTIFVGSQQSL